ncbi:MAG: DUF4440 domain-containing protein [Pseudonocardia sp.]|nr:DUF4440 domain-containing protein [Pseudonocardia sp.]
MHDDDDLARVIAGELSLLDPAVRRSPRAAGALLDPEFREFGSSGRVWDREEILDAMAAEAGRAPVVEDVVATWLGPDAVLVTYRAVRAARTTLRSSIWRRAEARWAVYFHQGTVAS